MGRKAKAKAAPSVPGSPAPATPASTAAKAKAGPTTPSPVPVAPSSAAPAAPAAPVEANDEATLGQLISHPAPAAAAASTVRDPRLPARAAERSRGSPAPPAEPTLQQLLDVPRPLSERPRWDTEHRMLRHGIIAGYLPTMEEPEQSLERFVNKESQEISSNPVLSESPIAKVHRPKYNWCARGEKGVLTMDPEKMVPCAKYMGARCDICGKSSETLYEFRCWEREGFRPEAQKDPRSRRLHDIIGYFGKDCGRGLLGRRTDRVQTYERAKELLDLDLSVEELEKHIQSLQCNRAQHNGLMAYVRQYSGQEEGIQNPELAKAEDVFGRLHRSEDPFRAVRRCLGHAVGHRDLAACVALSMKRAKRQPLPTGILARCMEGLDQGHPMPQNTSLSLDEVKEAFQEMTQALPRLKISLHDNKRPGFPSNPWIFQSEGASAASAQKAKDGKTRSKGAADPALVPGFHASLVYLYVVGGLHVEYAKPVPSNKQQNELRQAVKELLVDAPATWITGSNLRTEPTTYAGPKRAEDQLIEINSDSQVTSEHVLFALAQQVTWPCCTSRKNVTPLDKPSIEAFCVGLLKPWYSREMAIAKYTNVMPQLTRLLALFSRQIPEESHLGFRYSTIQLNKNYNARLHVDKNNHGLSWIIGLGDYTGGELWIYDPCARRGEKGVRFMKVEAKLRGYPQLTVGQEIPGRVYDIRNKWKKFDGRIPHAALDFQQGPRISLVYFSRQNCDNVHPEKREVLEGLGVPLPTTDWLAATREGDPTLAKPPQKVIELQRTGSIEADGDSSDDDEPDDYTEPGQHLQSDFGKIFGDQLKVTAKTPVALGVSAVGGGGAAAMAMKLLGFNCQACLFTDDNEGLRFAQAGGLLQAATKDLDSFVKGTGHCEVRHKDDSPLCPSEELLFHAVVPGSPLSLFAFRPEGEARFESSKETKLFRKIEEYLSQRRPPLALIEIPDFDQLYATYLRRAQDVIVFVRRRLEALGYHTAVSQVLARDVGLPLVSSVVHIYASQETVMPADKLQSVASLARGLGICLPTTRVQEHLLPDTDASVQDVQRKWCKNQVPVGFKSEYGDFLKGDMPKAWYFVSATSDEQKLVNQAYKRARDSAMDLASLLLDLYPSKKMREGQLTDDGLLPNPDQKLHYVFARHRPLTGREELMCRGFKLQDVSSTTLRDQELRLLASRVPLLPATAASLLAMLALATPRLLQVDPESLQRLIQEGEQLRPTPLRRDLDGAAQQVDEKEMKAAVMLAVLGRTMPQDSESPAKKGKQAQQEGDDEEGIGQSSDDLVQPSLLGKPLEEDFRDWETRARKLRCFMEYGNAWRDKLPFSRAMRWVAEAALEPCNEFSQSIVLRGLRYLELCMVANQGGQPALDKKEGESSEKLDKALTGLKEHWADLLTATQHVPAAVAGKVRGLCVHIVFTKGAREHLGLGGASSVTDFVQLIMKHIYCAEDFELFFETLPARWRDWSSEAVQEFVDADGPRVLCGVLEKATFTPQDKHAAAFNAIINTPQFRDAPGFRHALLVLVQRKGWRQSGAVCNVADEMDKLVLSPIMKSLRDFRSSGSTSRDEVRKTIGELVEWHSLTPLERRLVATDKMLEKICELRERVRQQESSGWIAGAEMLAEIMEETAGEAEKIYLNGQALLNEHLREMKVGQVPKEWVELAKLEEKLLKEDKAKLETKEREARKKAEQVRAMEQAEQRNAALARAFQEVSNHAKTLDNLLKKEKGSSGAGVDRLKGTSKEDIERMTTWCQVWLQVTKAAKALGATEGDLPKEPFERAKTAFADWQEQPGRAIAALDRLRRLGIPAGVIRLLQKGQLLERLAEIGHAPSLLDGLCLPPGVRSQLVQHAKEHKFDKESLQPTLPRGWDYRVSSSSQLTFYFLSKNQNQTQWLWPAIPEEEAVPQRAWPQELGPGLQLVADAAKYITASRGNHGRRCLLCDQAATQDHLEGTLHLEHRRVWRQLCTMLEEFCAGFAQLPKPADQLEQEWILQCWQEVIMQEVADPSYPHVNRCFLQLIIEPNWPQTISSLPSSLQRALEDARHQEPDLVSYPAAEAIPRPGIDIPVLPEGQIVELHAQQEASWRLLEDMGPQDLLRHGLVLQESGLYHCIVCSLDDQKPVEVARTSDLEEMLMHLSVTNSKVGKAHNIYRAFWESQHRFLRQEGWRLKDQGVTFEGRAWSCACGKTGDLQLEEFRGHFRNKQHERWERANTSKTSKAVEDKLKAHWEEHYGRASDVQTASLQEMVRQRSAALPAAPVKRRAPGEVPESTPAARPSAPAAKASTLSEPPLPEPGKAFPDLSGGVFEVRPKEVKCLLCSETFPKDQASMQQHKQSRNHKHYEHTSLAAFKRIKELGPDLWRHGMAFKDVKDPMEGKLVCQCSKEIPWWSMLEWFPYEGEGHVTTNAHKKWLRSGSAPTASKQPWEDARKERWLELVAGGTKARSEELPSSPQRRKAEALPEPLPEPKAKRPHTEEDEWQDWPQSKSHEALVLREDWDDNAPSSSTSRQRTAWSMPRAKQQEPPSDKDCAWAEAETSKRYYPELTLPLRFGWFDAKGRSSKPNHKEAWLFCTKCRVWVSSVAWHTESQELSICEDQGYCTHWDDQRHLFT